MKIILSRYLDTISFEFSRTLFGISPIPTPHVFRVSVALISLRIFARERLKHLLQRILDPGHTDDLKGFGAFGPLQIVL